jgi:hypothetical protein
VRRALRRQTQGKLDTDEFTAARVDLGVEICEWLRLETAEELKRQA